jgi:hypothetical protein
MRGHELTDDEKRRLAIAAIASAVDAVAELLRFVREGGWITGHFQIDAAPVERLLDAAKMTIEIEGPLEATHDRGQILAAIEKHLEGWVP